MFQMSLPKEPGHSNKAQESLLGPMIALHRPCGSPTIPCFGSQALKEGYGSNWICCSLRLKWLRGLTLPQPQCHWLLCRTRGGCQNSKLLGTSTPRTLEGAGIDLLLLDSWTWRILPVLPVQRPPKEDAAHRDSRCPDVGALPAPDSRRVSPTCPGQHPENTIYFFVGS